MLMLYYFSSMLPSSGKKYTNTWKQKYNGQTADNIQDAIRDRLSFIIFIYNVLVSEKDQKIDAHGLDFVEAL